MYEHPSLTYRLIESERAELERAAERRRFLREHADQIVPRPPGAVRRMLRRLRGVPQASVRDAVAASPAAVSRSSENRAPGACGAIPAR